MSDVRGLLTPSSELTPPSGTKIVYNISGPPSVIFKPSNVKNHNDVTVQSLSPATSGTNSGGAAGATAKSTASSSANSTQFGSMITFMLTYGINGGPTWTLSTFKGPGGGGGPQKRQLLSATRAHTATLQLTFVAACNDYNNLPRINDYWQSIYPEVQRYTASTGRRHRASAELPCVKRAWQTLGCRSACENLTFRNVWREVSYYAVSTATERKGLITANCRSVANPIQSTAHNVNEVTPESPACCRPSRFLTQKSLNLAIRIDVQSDRPEKCLCYDIAVCIQ